MIEHDPSVSPPVYLPVLMMHPDQGADGPGAVEGVGPEVSGDRGAVAAEGEAREEILESQDPEQAQPTKEKRTPCTPTQSEIDEHNVTHAPYRPWCDCCAEAFGREDGHYAGDGGSERRVPVIHMDDLFLSSRGLVAKGGS